MKIGLFRIKKEVRMMKNDIENFKKFKVYQKKTRIYVGLRLKKVIKTKQKIK